MPTTALAPDRILLNANIHTVDPDLPAATGVAIKDGRFVAVGADADIRNLSGPKTVVEDLAGATVIPGLIDAHNHLLATGRVLGQVSLYDCRTIAEITDRIAARAAESPAGTWIIGRGWDESLLDERRHPTRSDLDWVSPDHPVVIHRVWNRLVANTPALAAANISRETPDPSADEEYGGSFERDERGEPTGLFHARAQSLILDAIPEPREEERVAAIAAACRAYNALGITGVAEPGLYPREIRAFQRAQREGVLTVRTELLLAAWGFGKRSEDIADDGDQIEKRLEAAGVTGGFGDDLLRLEGVKLMPDGGISDRTAKMHEAYDGEPDNTGAWVIEPERLSALIRWVHDLGWSMDIHTCGSLTQEVVVRAYAAAQDAAPKPWLRHRVHHAYLPTPETLAVMASHQIPALVSSPFLTNLGEGFVNALGADRAARMMPMRTYLDAGIPLAGSSDSPITDFNPWVGMHAAAVRETVTGRPLGPRERLTPAEALHSYTLGGAHATGQEANRGSISIGKLADLVVLGQDPLAIPAAELRDVRPVATLLGGEWVYDRRD